MQMVDSSEPTQTRPPKNYLRPTADNLCWLAQATWVSYQICTDAQVCLGEHNGVCVCTAAGWILAATGQLLATN